MNTLYPSTLKTPNYPNNEENSEDSPKRRFKSVHFHQRDSMIAASTDKKSGFAKKNTLELDDLQNNNNSNKISPLLEKKVNEEQEEERPDRLIRLSFSVNSPKNRKKSFSLPVKPRTSIYNISKKKQSLKLANEEDFKIFTAILKKTGQQRTDHEIELMKTAFEQVKFFEDVKNELNESFLDKLYKELKYEFAPKKSIIFNLGDLGRKFYVVIGGSVTILLKKQGLEENPDEKKSEIKEDNEIDKEDGKKKRKVMLKKILEAEKNNLPLPSEVNELSDEEFIEIRFPSFFGVRNMKVGDIFGEVALRQNVARTATVIANKDSHLAVLTRESFQNILSAHYDKLINENLEFLKSLPLFKNWSMAAMEQLYHQFQITEYRKNDIIYKENEPSKNFYFIKIGEVEISKYIVFEEPILSAREKDNFLPRLKEKIENKRQRIKLSLLTIGEMFGQEEIIKDTIRTTMAVVYSSKATIFRIEKEPFFAFVKDRKTLKILNEMNTNGNEWREDLIESDLGVYKEKKNEKKMIDYLKNVKILSRYDGFKEREPYDLSSLTKRSNDINYKMTHLSQKIRNFNENYDKILKIHQRNLTGHKFLGEFNNIFIDDPRSKNMLNSKLKSKHKKETSYNSEILNSFRLPSSSFFSMNLCKNVIKKKQDNFDSTIFDSFTTRTLEPNLSKTADKSEKPNISDFSINLKEYVLNSDRKIDKPCLLPKLARSKSISK